MKVLNWGLIGAGDIARKRIAPALRDLENCEFVSVSRSRFFSRKFPAKEDAKSTFYSTKSIRIKAEKL